MLLGAVLNNSSPQRNIRENLEDNTTAKKELSLLMPALKDQYHVGSLEIFGSYARGESSSKSDLDLLITFSQPYSLWDLLDVKEFLSEKLQLKS